VFVESTAGIAVIQISTASVGQATPFLLKTNCLFCYTGQYDWTVQPVTSLKSSNTTSEDGSDAYLLFTINKYRIGVVWRL